MPFASRAAGFVILLLVSAVALERPAAAQAPLPAATADPRKDAKMRLGPFYVTPRFELTNLGIDTNVFNTTEDPLSDEIITAVPHADIWLPMAKRALVTTSVSAGLNYFHTYASERSIDPSVTVRGDLFLHRLTLFAEDSYLRARQRPNTEIDARSRRIVNAPSAGAILRLAPRLSAEVAGYMLRLQYDQDQVFLGTSLSQSLNHDETGVRVTLRARVTSLTTLTIRAEQQRDRFEFSPDRNADARRVTAGFDFAPKALINGSIEVGARQFVTKDATLPDFTGVVAAASLRYTLLKRTRLGVTWDRDVAYSYQPDQPYYVANVFGGSIQEPLRGRMDLIVSAQRGTSAYRAFETLGASGNRVDTTVSYSADLGWRLNRNLRAGFVVSSSKRTSSTDPSRRYQGMRAGISVAYMLPG